jgi:hypothetical protein
MFVMAVIKDLGNPAYRGYRGSDIKRAALRQLFL